MNVIVTLSDQSIVRFEADPNETPESVAERLMAAGIFDRSREGRGRVDYYPPSKISKIEFNE